MNPRHFHGGSCRRTTTPATRSLDVPLSVWLSAHTGDLVTELVAELAPAHSLSTLVGLPLDAIPPVSQDHGLVVLTHHGDTHPSREDIAAPVTSVVTSPAKVAHHLASMPAAMDLVVASDHWSHGEDFFTACTVALKGTGYLAVVAHSANLIMNAATHRRVTEAGMRYLHHIAAVHPRELTRATSIAPATTAAETRRLYTRHKDVFIYATGRPRGRA